jgi:hypothetical protein
MVAGEKILDISWTIQTAVKGGDAAQQVAGDR